MKEVAKTFHIPDSAVHNVTDKTAYLLDAIISIPNEGANWTFGIRDKQVPAMYAIPPTILAKETNVAIKSSDLKRPMLMQGGIDIVTAGGTPGAVDVWIWYAVP